jgi:allantoin racemase
MSVRILYQFATAKQHTDLGQAEVERRLAYLRTKVSPGTEVEVATPPVGPGSIESEYEAALAVPEILRSIDQAQACGFDAVIISCFSDPGLEPAREIARIPILASGLCAMHAAAMLGQRFAIMSPLAGGNRGREQARRYGLESFFASSRGIGLSVMELARDREGCMRRIIEAGRAAIDQDGADVLILGCMSMAFHDVAEDLQERLGAPVVNPVAASLAMAEYLARSRLCHSKRAWPDPPKREFLR